MHDLLAPLYETRHREIFNPVEQRRIAALLQSLLQPIKERGTPYALDFGAGTGNLTRQLLQAGASVLAADVSEGCLKELQSLNGRPGLLKTMTLNGRDLSGVASGSLDLVATYSVLHHVPDYLGIIDEFVRVVKPGGLIYLDHEVCPSYWEKDRAYLQYQKELEHSEMERTEPLWKMLPAILPRKCSWRYLWAALRLRVHPTEDDGDIHVTEEDHIEWSAIRERLVPFCRIVAEEDYLVSRELQDPPPVWSRWSDRCVDMRYLVARKN